jgi:glucose-6-phosphate isomerase
MLYKHTIHQNLVSSKALKTYEHQALQAQESLRREYDLRVYPLLDLPFQRADLPAIHEAANFFADHKRVYIFGTGGSSLGGQLLANLTYNHRLVFIDNIDPHHIHHLLSDPDFDQYGFLFISKSGSTPETFAQFSLYTNHIIKTYGADHLKKSMMVITEPDARPLRTMAETYGMMVLDHDPEIGGRYSIFSIVGLLAGALAGLDIEKIRYGAQKTVELSLATASAPAMDGAIMHMALMNEANIQSTTLMPYCDRLRLIGPWFAQLWAESLGKDGLGTTAISAIGTVDQHSQLQLYLDGPNNKFHTIIGVESTDDPLPFAQTALCEHTDYLKNRTLMDLFTAEQQATTQALKEKKRPIREIIIPKVTENIVGGLLMHFMIETILCGKMMDVNPFDQPAVERIKVLARDFLA